MSKPLKPKRGTTAENDAFTGQAYEVTLDTETHRLRTHDGTTAGGYEHALMKDTMVGASASAKGKTGLVPEPAAGDQNKVLLGNAKWGKLSEQPDFVDLADRVTEAESKTGLPLGYIFTWPFSTPPDGCIIANGAEYSIELYGDLWNYVVAHCQPMSSFSEWETYASSHGGYCPFYAYDSTTEQKFKTPKFAPYQQLAISAASTGTYHQGGLPDIDGHISDITSARQGDNASFTGAFRRIRPYASAAWAGATSMQRENEVEFKASYSNQHYGRSDTVQPESNEWIVCVVAYGSATNVGNVDVANVMSAVSLAQAKAEDAVEINSSGYSSSQHWVRYKDGRQIIYSDWSEDFVNKTISFVKAFSTPPSLIGFDNDVHPAGVKWDRKFSVITVTYFTINEWAYGSNYKTGCWIAFGTWK